MNTHPPNEETILEQALSFASPEARQAFLQGACGGNEQLRARVQSLIEAHEAAGGFLAENTKGVATTIRIELQPEERPGTVIGRYKLLQQIGEGGCGVVYMAEQEEPVRRRVALKVIKLGMDTKSVIARFEAERQALALMDHPNIAKVLDAGATDTGRPYFVMELVRGIRITDYCDQNNLSTKERLGLFVQVCHAIQHAHQKGIIHRDIKPSNILVSMHDGVPVPVVIDFGIAKATEQRLTDKTLFTAFEQFIGTPAYTSPEQAEMSRLDIDTRSDIYSLGVLLYELLTGKTPFDAKELLAAGLEEMRRTIREKEPARPSTRLSTMLAGELTTTAKRRQAEPPKLINLLRGDLDWIVMKALEKDRTRRYETATGLAQDIQRHLDNEPVAARSPSTAYRLQKAWRRNRLAFTAGAAVAVALIIGIGVSTWQAVVADRAKNAEKEQRLAAQTERDKAIVAQQAEKQARLRADAEKEEAAHNLYVANMSLAQQVWDESNIGRLQQVLEDTRDSPHRGFEWYYWQKQTHLALKTLRGHVSWVSSVAYSPNGQRIVTGSGDHTAKVWEVASGRELLTLKGHMDMVNSVAFSADGQRIATGSGDETARVWDAASGRELVTLRGQSGLVGCVALSPDGQRIAVCSWNQQATVWETASGRQLLTLKGHGDGDCCVAFSPDGRRIVTGGSRGMLEVWEAANGQELFEFKGHGDTIGSVAFSWDGQRIVTGSQDRTAKVWDAATGRELFTLRGHSDQVNSVAFSTDGQRIVTGSSDRTAKVWDAANGQELDALKGHSDSLSSVAFSSDGQRIATGSGDKSVKLWDAARSGKLLTLIGHTYEVSSVAFSPDGRRIATGSYGDVKVWEVATGRELLTLKGHNVWPSSVAFSPDSQRIALSAYTIAKVCEVASGRELLTLKGHNAQIRSVAFSPDGLLIVTGSEDKTARLWEAASGKELLSLKGHSSAISSAAFSPDGRRVITGSNDKTAKVWEAASGRELLTLKGHSSGINSAAFSPDGRRVITGSNDKTAKVWEAAGGRELLTLKGHASGINSAAFSPDGQRIVTASADKTAKVWEGASGRELLTIMGHSDFICSAVFSPDGQRIVTGSGDKTAKVWEGARPEQVAAWEKEERAEAQSLGGAEREWTGEKERQRIARDHDSIKHWLVLAPIALVPGQSAVEGLGTEQIEGEGQLRPKAGDARAISGGELRWREVVLEVPAIDFNLILGKETTQSVAYAVCYLRSEAEQRGLQLLVGGGDEAKIYLNGNQVYKAPVRHEPMFCAGGRYVPDIALNAGVNVLVFKAVNGTNDWESSICLTDAQGNPVKGVKVTLDPEAKESTQATKP